jgi:hypothetical protein
VTARVVIVLAVWLVVACLLGASGRLTALRPPAPQAIILGLTAILLVMSFRVSALRGWLAALDPRWLVGLHLTRFVGIYFLVLAGRDELARAFAVPAGWGDILVATGALLLVLTGPGEGDRRSWFLVWNVVGLLDIVLVVITAARLWIAGPVSMGAMLRMPLSLLPTYLVPLIIATHVILFRRIVGGFLAAHVRD